MEAASYSLITNPDPKLARRLNRVVDLIASAQQPDGYMNVYFTVVEPEKRWTNLRDGEPLERRRQRSLGPMAQPLATPSDNGERRSAAPRRRR